MKFRPMDAKVYHNENIFGSDYIFEPKLDGYRALCYKNSGLKFFSRNGNDLTNDFPELQTSKSINAKKAVLDGEIVIYNERGRPDFNLIQNRAVRKLPAFYIVFDILILDDEDLMSLTLVERKNLLKKAINESGNFQLIVYTENGGKMIEEMKKRRLEGVMAKKKFSRYIQGRSSDWLKIKFVKTLDCVIIGYTTYKREISSLLLGVYEKGKLVYVGKVGTGFNEKTLRDLKEKFNEFETEKYMEIRERNIKWLKPKLVAEILYSEVTPNKKLRASVFKNLRDDKNAKECEWEN